MKECQDEVISVSDFHYLLSNKKLEKKRYVIVNCKRWDEVLARVEILKAPGMVKLIREYYIED
jgi:hypothetical protein